MGNSGPKYSIICPTYNSEKYLPRMFESVLQQSFDAWEVIVVDDCSKDASYQLALEYAARDTRIRVFRLAANSGGPATPRNVGAQEAKGAFLAFLDADDWWMPRKLEKVQDYEMTSDLTYHSLAVERPSRPHRREIIRALALGREPFLDLMVNGNGIPLSSVTIRASLFHELGGFDTAQELTAVEDFDLWLRCAKKGCRFAAISEPLGHYWIGDNNTSRPSERNIERIRAVFHKHIGDVPATQKGKVLLALDYLTGRQREKMDDWWQAMLCHRNVLLGAHPTKWHKSAVLIAVCMLEHVRQRFQRACFSGE